MSVSLPDISLVGLTVGQSVHLDLSPVGVSAGAVTANSAFVQNLPHLYIYNDSGSGLNAVYDQSRFSFKVPAGSWKVLNVPLGETGVTFTVNYNLPNPPVSLLMCEYYSPGEEFPHFTTLGNSPIQGATTTPTTNSLSQEGNAKTQLTIDIGDSALAQLLTINNDGTAIWKVDVSSVAHQVLKIASAGNLLQLGQAGDTVEQLGSERIDQNLNVQGTSQFTGLITMLAGLILPNNVALQSQDVGGTARNLLWEDTSNNSHVSTGAGNAFSIQDNTGNDQLTVTTTQITSTPFFQANNGITASTANGVIRGDRFEPVTTNTSYAGAIAGSVSGQLIWKCPVWGSAIKIMVVQFQAYQSANSPIITFPTAPFTAIVFPIYSTGASLFGQLQTSGGIGQTLKPLATFATTAAEGTYAAGGPQFRPPGIFLLDGTGSAITRLQFSSATASVSGQVILVGI